MITSSVLSVLKETEFGFLDLEMRLRRIIELFRMKRHVNQVNNLIQYSQGVEPCPNCGADLFKQKGYSQDLPCWTCKGCGEMLINPELDAESDIVWICDDCGAILNIQDGFTEKKGEYVCKACGHTEHFEKKDIFRSEEEYKAYRNNPYYGLADEDMLCLAGYEETQPLGGRQDIVLVRNITDGQLYVRKFLKEYNIAVFTYLKEHPIAHMPRIIEFYESKNALITIEEYIPGKNLQECIEESPFSEKEAAEIGKRICDILIDLQNQETLIIHRDLKPSNVILSIDGQIYLIDVNVAKFFDAEESEDTRLLGTRRYAAPEQVGYGFEASSERTDVYGLGMLLNVIVTLQEPKQERVSGILGDIILKCINMEPQNRPTVKCLKEMLEEVSKHDIR